MSYARLHNASLNNTFVRRADLTYADLGYADLSGANLSNAKGATEEQLAECASLAGATMPNGQKYEEWLKDKKGSEENK